MAEAVEGESQPPVAVSKESTLGGTTESTYTDSTLETTEEGTERTESNTEQTGGEGHGTAGADEPSKKEDETAAEDKEINDADKDKEVKLEEQTEDNQSKDEKTMEVAPDSNDVNVENIEGDQKEEEKEVKPEEEAIAGAGQDKAGEANEGEVNEGEANEGDGGKCEEGVREDILREEDKGLESGVNGEKNDKPETSGTESTEYTDGSGGQLTETTEGKVEDGAEETDQAPTVELSAKPTTDSVAILTAITEEEEDEETQEELRQELMEQIMSGLEEKKTLKGQKSLLEQEIAEYLAKKKADKDQLELPRPAPDIRNYSIILNKVSELRSSMERARERQARKEEKLVAKMNNDMEQARRASKTGKRLTAADLDYYHAVEDEKEEEIKKIRLNNIKLAAKMSKLNESLRQKEQLAQGLHMIDFEQLKINNIDLNEKIEERNDDILKLRKKVTSTVQVLTHVKEKLQFLQQEKAERKAVLSEIEVQLAIKRDELTHLKQARDALRADNQRLKQKGGLVGHKTLLRDFEERLDESEEMRLRLEQLQKRHSELAVMCDGIKKKIETAKQLEAEAIANREFNLIDP